MDPASLKYAPSHEWIHVDGDIATIGISEFAVHQLTDLVFIELPEVGRTLEPGDDFGVVESVKAVSDLYAPVAGEVTEVNSSLEDNLDPLTDDPFGAGWIIKLKVTDASGLDQLMDQAAYQAHCAAEEH
ncbi:MAG: glycine cleavage system protein GcvH [Planctomycetaceae bacterium]|nr:glycine cleavage system protein GcvH [Planctomycetaceae bacterium]